MTEARTVSFFVSGTPVPKGRARTAIRHKKDGSQFISHSTPKETVSYEARFRRIGKQAFTAPFEGPVEVRLVFHFAPAPSASPRVKASLYGKYMPIRCDIDNLGKSCLDSINRQPLKRGKVLMGWDLVAWRDDVQVCRLLMSKRYIAGPDSPVGVSVTITELEPRPEPVPKLL